MLESIKKIIAGTLFMGWFNMKDDFVQDAEEKETLLPFKLLAVVQEADVPNKNNRIYPKLVLDQQVERLQEPVRNRSLFGELGIPTESVVHLDKASHLVTDLYMSDNKLMAEIEVLDSPLGAQLRSLLSAGVSIGFRMSGLGEGKLDQYGNFVLDSYNLVQIFACSDPA